VYVLEKHEEFERYVQVDEQNLEIVREEKATNSTTAIDPVPAAGRAGAKTASARANATSR
jgi:hypothetical protein